MTATKERPIKIAVVIPCYRVQRHILGVIEGIGPEVDAIYMVDDACPERSGAMVAELCPDPRVKVLFHERNQGVGGATMTGYRQALADGADIMVKIDGDGQMNPAMIPLVTGPIANGLADYTKGNRFYYLEGLSQMPLVRMLGNAALSFFTKVSSGYWDIFDPTNGFTAVHRQAALRLPFDKIDRRYFFESDLLFRLNTIRAVVMDVPMPAQYGDEESSLSPLRVLPGFLKKHLVNGCKRIFYNYYLRDFSVASLQIVIGIACFLFGVGFGALNWENSLQTGVIASSGTVMVSGLPTLVGVQLILAFISADVGNVPKLTLQKRLGIGIK